MEVIYKLFRCFPLFLFTLFFTLVPSCSFLGAENASGSSSSSDLILIVDDVSASEITITVENASNYSYGYGAGFKLEELSEHNKWVPVNSLEGVSWQQEDWISYINPGEIIPISYSWDWYYGHLPSGNYRILVEFLTEDANSSTIAHASFSIS